MITPTTRRIFAAVWLVLLSVGSTVAVAGQVTLRSGDVLTIRLPGEEAFDKSFQVSTDGAIVLPEAGDIDVQGLTLDQARKRIRSALSVIYRDLERLDVVLEDRRLLVQVLGFVKEPGLVDLDPRANIQTAIKSAGGLRQGAQLDRLQLRRGEQVVVFNYKEYLDTGSLAILPGLEPMDVVFVPASPLIGNVQVEFDARTLTSAGDSAEDGTAITVFGEVANPGTFAFKPGQSVVDMIMRAGGVTRYAGVEKIRIMNGAEPALFDLKGYLDTGDETMMPAIGPGATVYVPINTEEVKAGTRTVYVMGEVAKPGAFEMTDGANFFDVLANAGGPNRYAETRELRIIRANGKVIPFNLAGYTEGVAKMAVPTIEPGDAIFVPEKTDQLEKSWLKVSPNRAIRIIGQVVRPGRYEWSDEMSLLDLLAHAGGPTRMGDVSKLQILKSEGGSARPLVFDLDRFMNEGGNFDELPAIGAGDTVKVPELPRDPSDNKAQWVRQSSDRSIYIMGAVGSPGRYAFNENLHFLDILSAADGPRPDADIQSIRVSHRGRPEARVTPLNLALYFDTGDESLLPSVRPGDVIYVPSRNREWTEVDARRTVRVIGAVGSPGRYTFDDSMTILDLLAEAGGPRPDAWQERVVVANMVNGEPKAQSFDLVAFARSGDFSTLPVVRAGDTVYVPNVAQSDWRIFMSGVRDALSVISIFAILGGL